jgi:probable HAF family extracellular repeat protein
MKFGTYGRVRAITIFAALLALVCLAARAPQAAQSIRYKLIDLGTFGGPNAGVNGPGTRDLSNSGIYAGEADTSIADPYAPICQSPDCMVQHAQEWRNGAVIDLGTLPGGNLSSGATQISADGRFISGVSDNGIADPLTGATTEWRAVVWTPDGHIHNLGTLPGGTESFGLDVNSRGEVIAASNNAVPDPFSPIFSWRTQTRTFLLQNGFMQDIGTLGGPDTFALTINDQGQITGQSYINSTPNADNSPSCPPGVPAQDPFLWDKGRMIDIGSLGGTCSLPNRLNNRGQVVGISYLADNRTVHAFFWDRGVLTDIGTLGGPTSQALDLSDSGLVVGTANLADGTHHAFVWKDGVLTDVGVVPGDLCSNGLAVNSRGQVIGTSTDCMGTTKHMFLWENGSMHDLTAMILPGSDIDVIEAWDMNDRGEIAAVGVLPNGDQHAVLLVPASAEEIAAANALTVSQPRSTTVHTHVKTSENAVFGGRNRALNMLWQTRRMP